MIIIIFEFLKKEMENYLEKLNPAQRKAAMHTDGPIMVIAGAGSGKTRVLTYRIVHLLKQKINPFNILALTFTNKASKEMRNRIEEIVGEDNARNLWMGTFHSIFSRILRFEAEKINYSPNFTIYDTEDSKNLIKSIIKELNLDKEIYKTGIIRNRISTLKNNFITVDKYIQNTDLNKQDNIAKRTEFGKIYQLYCSRCQKSSAMDFDDLLLKTYELFDNDKDVLSKYQEKFKYILIDEYQDTNHVQYLIIKKLAKLYKNICIVGDDAQSIYSFRGANIQNILNFKLDYPEYKTYKLEQNYRSTKTIVEAANSIIKKNEKQIKKNVWTNNTEGDKIIIAKTGSDNDEGRLVANTISDIKIKYQTQYKDFAILYRTNAQSRALEESLRKRNLSYKIYGGISFYQRKEIKDILAYFRLIINPNDDEALKRIINFPRRGIGLTTIQNLNLIANNNNTTIWKIIKSLDKYEININKGTIKKLEEFSLFINNFIINAKKKEAFILAEEIIKQTGLLSSLSADTSMEGISRLDNVQELLNGLKNFCESNENNKLSDFMQEVSLLTDQDQEKEDDDNKITLMTVHAAKGLEFPYVFIVGLEENLFPNVMSSESQESLEEERRLFYVAITRAEKRLFISFASTRFKWGQFTECIPSRFINELDNKYIEKQEMAIEKEYYQHSIQTKTKYRKKELFQIKNKTSKKLININKTKNISINKNDLTNITNGMQVRHNQFGTGKVINISGDGNNKKAIVFFNGIGQKQLLLKFAKLEILN